MAYRRRGGKVVKWERIAERLPYTPTGYIETEAEQHALMQRPIKLDRREYTGGIVRFVIPGLPPDTTETLIAAGLLGEERLPDGRIIQTFLEPHNLRLIAWAMGVNATAKKHGRSEVFPNLAAELGLIGPGTGTRQ